eukprot:CAMPEP_0180400256 /NCGR_PEP_ID=MMETSP0989-20121125/37626_1 /TAXON_ID=697907 /ORGANISM="non described non described, Strain CCMP2293" /LENGTH=66 /DNA_ID=CAMNT_0022403075 /DNA_START=25 /DNA_END=225 /DNA_ORIENTATION=+
MSGPQQRKRVQPLRQPASKPAGVRGSRKNEALLTLFGYPLQQEQVALLGILILALIVLLVRFVEGH